MLRRFKDLIPTPLKAAVKTVVKRDAALRTDVPTQPPDRQNLDVYWDPDMADMLESWGEGNAWHEIVYLVAALDGPILDIACGTGRVMEILRTRLGKDVYGCDISEFLLSKARDRGIPEDTIFVEDATKLSFSDDRFAHAYSIGSLEHFTEEGILAFLAECKRTVRGASFHMIPVSRSDQDEGWLRTHQSFFNNSVDWWLNRYRSVYPNVLVLDSAWNDDLSIGKWFACSR